MPSLLIADDHPLFRAALRQAAVDAVADTHIFEADSLDSVLAALEREAGIDLVCLHMRDPPTSRVSRRLARKTTHWIAAFAAMPRSSSRRS